MTATPATRRVGPRQACCASWRRRHAHGQLPRSGRAPRELKIRHVGAGDEKDDDDGAEHDQQSLAHAADQRITQWYDLRASTGVRYRILLRELSGDSGEITTCGSD